jgi:hypothetical protein
MSTLKTCLWIIGVFYVGAAIALCMPLHWLESFLNVSGGPPLPGAGAFLHLARSSSILILGVGVFYIVLARSPVRYWGKVPFAGLGAILFGIAVGISGLAHGLPPFYYVKDSLIALVCGSLIVIQWRRQERRPEPGAP